MKSRRIAEAIINECIDNMDIGHDDLSFSEVKELLGNGHVESENDLSFDIAQETVLGSLRQTLEQFHESNSSESMFDLSDNDPDYVPRGPKPQRLTKRRHPPQLDSHDSSDSDTNYIPGTPKKKTQKTQKLLGTRNTSPDLSHNNEQFRNQPDRNAPSTSNEKPDEISLKPGCIGSCKRNKKCSDLITENERLIINRDYSAKDYGGKKSFLLERVHRENIKRKRIEKQKKSRRHFTFKYTLKTTEGVTHTVCKSFFFSTIGERSDHSLTKLFERADDLSKSTTMDKRGKHAKRSCDREAVKAFIEKYNPVRSHYYRGKVPNRRYLPGDLTVKGMYKEYIKTHSDISYSAFYSTFKEMNITIKKLGNEQCETCELYENHKKQCTCEVFCDISEYIQHKKRYTEARKEYAKDRDQSGRNPTSHLRVSSDLQKVILLPRMDEFKEGIFTPRLVVFNETISTLGKGTDTAIVWHEAISGRQDEDITSAFYKWLISLRDVTEITIWLDNCAGQNKNWTFYTMLLHFVNMRDGEVETLNLKYFEPGHTYMASDAAHGRIEQHLTRKNKVYDFKDFLDSVKDAACDLLELQYSDFANWESGVSMYTLNKLGENRPYRRDIVCVKFVKGSEMMAYQKSFGAEYISVPIIKTSFSLQTDCKSKNRSKPRGILPAKKSKIIDKLLPLMPKSRRLFWLELPTNDKSSDLETNF